MRGTCSPRRNCPARLAAIPRARRGAAARATSPPTGDSPTIALRSSRRGWCDDPERSRAPMPPKGSALHICPGCTVTGMVEILSPTAAAGLSRRHPARRPARPRYRETVAAALTPPTRRPAVDRVTGGFGADPSFPVREGYQPQQLRGAQERCHPSTMLRMSPPLPEELPSPASMVPHPVRASFRTFRVTLPCTRGRRGAGRIFRNSRGSRPAVLVTTGPSGRQAWRLDAYFAKRRRARLDCCARWCPRGRAAPLSRRSSEIGCLSHGARPIRAGRFFVHTRQSRPAPRGHRVRIARTSFGPATRNDFVCLARSTAEAAGGEFRRARDVARARGCSLRRARCGRAARRRLRHRSDRDRVTRRFAINRAARRAAGSRLAVAAGLTMPAEGARPL